MSEGGEFLYLSYSGRKTFLTCPRQYYFRYIVKDRTQSDPRGSMFGTAIGKLFEWFYEERLWSLPDPVTSSMSRINDAISYAFDHEGYVRGTDPSYESRVKEDMRSFVPSGIDIIKSGGFLTPYSRTEVDLTVTYSPPGSPVTLKMGGRADFIHGQTRDNVWILDGKASKHREKYVDSDQLIWYATQHYLKYHVAPSRLGFIFWCFPDAPISWIEYDSDSMRSLAKKTIEVSRRILDKDFAPTPSGECHRCPYKPKCDEGNIYLSKRKVESGGRIDDSVFEVERL